MYPKTKTLLNKIKIRRLLQSQKWLKFFSRKILKVLSATEKFSTTYSSVNLVKLVRAIGNSPERLFALRMLQSPKLKLRSFHVFRIKQINDNLEMTNQNLFEKLREKTQRNSQILQVNQISKLKGNHSWKQIVLYIPDCIIYS